MLLGRACFRTAAASALGLGGAASICDPAKKRATPVLDSFRLDGQVALVSLSADSCSDPCMNRCLRSTKNEQITGSSRGLGLGMAKALAEAGAHVILNSRSAADCAVPVAALNSAGFSASAQAFDVKSEESMKTAVGAIIEEHGKIDILVNNGACC